MDSSIAKKESLHSSLTCTQIKQKWGLPLLRAEQDPEKEMLKRTCHCVIVFSRTTGKIVEARDYSYPAGKRSYCKHIAAVAYKLVDSAMAKKESLHSSLTCTQIKQKWGLPLLRAEQDPEKEMLKRTYHCVIVFSRTTGKIVQARDYSCPAGKRGYCKHIAAVAYKLVDTAMAKKESLHSSLTCTQIKQK